MEAFETDNAPLHMWCIL